MDKSNSIKELATALCRAQAEMKPAAMNSTNPFLRNKYADLGAVIETAQPVLAKNGLSFSQLPTSNESGIGVTTILMHQSGEWLSDTLYLPVGEEKGKSLAQVAGSIITYLRRYALASMLGIYADEDTDGEQAHKPAQGKPEQPVAKPPAKTNGKSAAESFAAEAGAVVSSLTLETAENVKNSKGVRYGDLDSEALSNMTIGIDRALKNPATDPEHADELRMKRDAIRLILASRVTATGEDAQ